MKTLLLAHAASTCAMVGLIWLVQRVHYPLMAMVGPDRFVAYEQTHCRRITPIVGVLMSIELATAALLAIRPPSPETRLLCWVGLALVMVNWASTALVQVPLHERLSRAFDAAAIERLVSTNWIRTIAWTIRGAIALWLLR